jgi:hypothetical protein
LGSAYGGPHLRRPLTQQRGGSVDAGDIGKAGPRPSERQLRLLEASLRRDLRRGEACDGLIPPRGCPLDCGKGLRLAPLGVA